MRVSLISFCNILDELVVSRGHFGLVAISDARQRIVKYTQTVVLQAFRRGAEYIVQPVRIRGNLHGMRFPGQSMIAWCLKAFERAKARSA